jgi:hypothetical protein
MPGDQAIDRDETGLDPRPEDRICAGIMLERPDKAHPIEEKSYRYIFSWPVHARKTSTNHWSHPGQPPLGPPQ